MVTVKVQQNFQAFVRDEKGEITGVIYSQPLVQLIETAEAMKVALEAANEAWDSGFSDKRHEARRLVEGALAMARGAK